MLKSFSGELLYKEMQALQTAEAEIVTIIDKIP